MSQTDEKGENEKENSRRSQEDLLSSFSEKQKQLFIHLFNDGDQEDAQTPTRSRSGSVTVRNNIKNFFSKIDKNQELKNRLNQHSNPNRRSRRSRRKEVQRRRQAITLKNFSSEFEGLNLNELQNASNATEEAEIDSRERFKQETLFQKKSGEKRNLKEKKIENKFLYSEKTENEQEDSFVPPTPATTYRESGSIFHDSSQKRDTQKKHHSKMGKLTLKKLFRVFGEKSFWSKSSKEIRSDLKKYRAKLEEYKKFSEKKIEENRKKLDKTNTDLRNGIEVYENNSLSSLLDYFRKLYINKRLKYETRIRMEEFILERIERRIQRIRYALKEKKKSGVYPCYIREEFFCHPTDLAKGDKQLSELYHQLNLLENAIPQMEMIYQIERKIKAKGKSSKEMKEALLDLLTHARSCYCDEAIEDFDGYIWQDEIQDQFNKIVRDVRTEEGEQVEAFLSTIREVGLKKIPHFEITEFIGSFVDLMKKTHKFTEGSENHSLSKKYTLLLRQFSEKLFFSLIGVDLIELELEKQLEENPQQTINSFLRKKRLLAQLGADALVDKKFLDPEKKEMPYKRAINILNNIEFSVIPNDMVWAIYCCAKSATQESFEMCKKNGRSWGFGADELLPVIIYIIVHSECTYIASHLSYISRFGTEKNSECVYYLTCFEGAVMYVHNLSKDDLDSMLATEIPKEEEGKKKKEETKNTEEEQKRRETVKKLENLIFPGGN